MKHLSVTQLLKMGSTYAESVVNVQGWLADQFEHHAIYDSKKSAYGHIYTKGIWLSGNTPRSKPIRGDGSLHGRLIQIRGMFHWQPNKKAGHMGLFSAWIGVNDFVIIDYNLT